MKVMLHRRRCQGLRKLLFRSHQAVELRIWFLTDDILRIRAGLTATGMKPPTA